MFDRDNTLRRAISDSLQVCTLWMLNDGGDDHDLPLPPRRQATSSTPGGRSGSSSRLRSWTSPWQVSVGGAGAAATSYYQSPSGLRSGPDCWLWLVSRGSRWNSCMSSVWPMCSGGGLGAGVGRELIAGVVSRSNLCPQAPSDSVRS